MSATAVEPAEHDEHAGWPPDEHLGAASPGKLAMWVFLLSDAFSFGGLLLTYGVLRAGAKVWRDPALNEPALGVNFTAALTFLLICSSATMVLAHAAAVEGNRRRLCAFLGLTILGGVLFLCGQYHEYFGIVGGGLAGEGLKLGASAYASTFYVITSFHGAHVLAGVAYLSLTLLGALRGKYDDGRHGPIEICGLFWHFVDVVWILVFTLVYLI